MGMLYVFFLTQIVLACLVGYGFAYAVNQLSPLGKIKFKPFSCMECLTWWGGGVTYYLMTGNILEAVGVGFVAIVVARYLGAMEYRIAKGGQKEQSGCAGGCGGQPQTRTVKKAALPLNKEVEGSIENG